MKKSLLFALSAVTMVSISSCKEDEEVINEDDNTQGVSVSGKVGEYTYVDLGLSSGTLWATYNVGANDPKQYGSYFAWGETKTKDVYTYDNYKWLDDSGTYMWAIYTKYSLSSNPDNKLELDAEDDAVVANWGSAWCTPTEKQQNELLNGCTWNWTDDFNGTNVAGYLGTSKKNSKTIFLPAGGFLKTDSIALYENKVCHYWSSTLYSKDDENAFELVGDSLSYSLGYGSRCYGKNLRAVVK